MLGNPLDRNAGWISADGDTLTVLIGFYRLSPARQRGVLGQIEQLVASAPPGVQVSMTGLPILNRAMDDSMVEIAGTFFPLLAAIAVVLLWLCLGRLSQVVLPFAMVGMVQVVVFGAMGYSGASLPEVHSAAAAFAARCRSG